MTAGGRKKSLRAMVVAGNYNGVAGIKLGLPEVILKGHMTLLLVWSLYVQKKKVTCSCCFSICKLHVQHIVSVEDVCLLSVCRMLIVHAILCVLCRFWCR